MIGVLDYGLGNVGAIVNMLRAVGAESVITSDPVEIAGCDRLILGGVGAFDVGMENMRARGLEALLNERAARGTPILGICLGMQLMARSSEEGATPGLGWIAADVKRILVPEDSGLKIPHMGWNTVRVARDNPLIPNDGEEHRFYFVHSFHAVCDDPSDILATAHHGSDLTASFSRGNLFGVQFHPEKSHRFGMDLMRRFAELPC